MLDATPRCLRLRQASTHIRGEDGHFDSSMKRVDCKLGATGDVVRTTPIAGAGGRSNRMADRREEYGAARKPNGQSAMLFLARASAGPDIRYDLIINLEDTLEVGLYLKTLQTRNSLERTSIRESATLHRRFKALVDLSLISAYGREQADKLKLKIGVPIRSWSLTGSVSLDGEPYLCRRRSRQDCQAMLP